MMFSLSYHDYQGFSLFYRLVDNFIVAKMYGLWRQNSSVQELKSIIQ